MTAARSEPTNDANVELLFDTFATIRDIRVRKEFKKGQKNVQ